MARKSRKQRKDEINYNRNIIAESFHNCKHKDSKYIWVVVSDGDYNTGQIMKQCVECSSILIPVSYSENGKYLPVTVTVDRAIVEAILPPYSEVIMGDTEATKMFLSKEPIVVLDDMEDLLAEIVKISDFNHMTKTFTMKKGETHDEEEDC